MPLWQPRLDQAGNLHALGRGKVDPGRCGPDTVVPVEVGRADATPDCHTVVVDPQRVSHAPRPNNVVGHGHPKRAVGVLVVPVLYIRDAACDLSKELSLVLSRAAAAHMTILPDALIGVWTGAPERHLGAGMAGSTCEPLGSGFR